MKRFLLIAAVAIVGAAIVSAPGHLLFVYWLTR
jgi:hypothetical protein